MWGCPKVQEFWKEVVLLIFQMVSVNLPMNPEMFILGIFPDNIVHCSSTRKLIDVYTSSKASNSYELEKVERPSVVQWINNMSLCLSMEKITYILKGKLSLFENIWKPFISFISNSGFSNIMSEAGRDKIS